MKLIGMIDSPYVRRVAVSLALYGVEFESLPLSVFSGLMNSPVLIRWSRRRRWFSMTGQS